MKKALWAWWFILLILNVIPLGYDTNTTLSGNKIIFRLDYLVHVISFLGFGWLYVADKVFKSSGSRFRNAPISLFIMVLGSAAGFELLQTLIPWRSFNINDMIGNLMGAALVIIVILLLPNIATGYS